MRRAVATLAFGLLVGCASSGKDATDVTRTSRSTDTVDVAPTSQAPANSPPTTVTSPPTTASAVAPAASDVTFTSFITGVAKPVEISWRAGDTTLYVAQQSGKVIPIRNGAAGSPVLDISPLISTGPEQGLLGLALHPTKPFAYIDYTNLEGSTVIAEYAVTANGTFDQASARIVLTIAQPYPNHNGGKVVFGPDGFLYIGMGDGGAGGDPDRRALDLHELLGKILRIDPLAADGQPYSVPRDNPFVATSGARGEIWSIGVRNPWRFGFDKVTGDLWIADVGQNQWEEVDVALAKDGAGRGANFGWSAFEATHSFNADQPKAGATMPIFEYPHGDNGCSVSGGALYRGSRIGSLVGWYVFSDYCSGRIWATRPNGTVVTLGKLSSVSAIADGPDGELYVLAYIEGTIYRVDPA